MKYLIYLTFDLKGATAQQYQTAYAELEKLGLSRVQKNTHGGQDVIPTTSAMGFFSGESSAQLCETIRDQVIAAFKARGFKSELFFVTGDNWAWAASAT